MSKIAFQDFYNIHKFTYIDKKDVEKNRLESASDVKNNNFASKSNKSNIEALLSSQSKDLKKN